MSTPPDPMDESEARTPDAPHGDAATRGREDWSARARRDLRRRDGTSGSLGMAFLELGGFEHRLEDLDDAARAAARRALEDRIHACVRTDDPVCRWSEDEYVVLFRGTTEDECVEAIRRVKAKLEAPPFSVAGREVQVAATFGVVVVNSHESEHELESLMEMAAASFRHARGEGPGAMCVSRA